MKLCVIGAGYVGLTTAACLAEIGHDVVAVEVEEGRLAELRAGAIPFFEPGLAELVRRNADLGRLAFAPDARAAVADAQIALLAVSTSPLPGGRTDPGNVFDAARAVLAHAAPGLTLVVKSTVPVGTCEQLARLCGELGRADVEVVSNPEFLRQGTAVRDCLVPDRIVVGTRDLRGADAVARLYEAIDAPIVPTSWRSAELAKYVANSMLAARVSLINEIADICDATGADLDEITEVVGMDPRIGSEYLRAGIGWGGSCLPRDVPALSGMAREHDLDTPILDAINVVNTERPHVAAALALDAIADVPSPRVAVLGLAFKPGTDDLRGAPALTIIRELLARGASVSAHDPAAIEKARRVVPEADLHSDPYTVVEAVDLVLLATDWPEYITLDWSRVRALMRGRTIVDGRNALDAAALKSLGFQYLGFGRRWRESEATRRPGTRVA